MLTNSPVKFTNHAFDKVMERLSMDPDEIAALLHWNYAVKIGEKKGSNCIFRLFYSSDDSQFFVALQDEKENVVVTILPADYFENLNWKIPQSFFAEAEQLVSG